MTGSLACRFEATVDVYGDLPAVDTGTEVLTFSELDTRADRVAAWLTASGIRRGDRIGLALWNHIEHLELLLGAFKAGVVPVNVNCRYTAIEAEALLADADVKLVVHEATSTLTISDASRAHDWVRLSVESWDAPANGPTEGRPVVERTGDDPYILYTGGSTGTPKGVVWRQADLFTAAMAPADERRPGSRMLPASPLTHGTAQWITMSTLLSAGTVVFGPRHGVDAVALWTRVADAGVTRLVIVGDAFARPLLDALDAEPDRWDLSTLVAITSGGARWSIATQRGLLEHLPHVAMVNSFGASETGGQGSQVSFAGELADPTGSASDDPATGLLRFEPDATAVVLDEHRRPIPAGSAKVGLLARRGPVPLGYHNDAVRSEQVFPVIDGVRHAIPGDMAMIDETGAIVVLGRDKNVINTGGEKVFAEEVETRLMAHPSVSHAVVVGMPDERWGETIGALVTVDDDAEVAETELADHCAATLARFKIPRRIEIVERIRYLPTGKLDRRWATDTMAALVSTTTRGPLA